MKTFILLILAIPLVGLSQLIALVEAPQNDSRSMTLDQEVAYAKNAFAKEKNVAVLRVYGLICESCSFGIVRKMSEFEFLDNERFNRGIQYDVFTQFIHVAIKPGAKADAAKMLQAVLDAGYEPKTIFLNDTVVEVSDKRVLKLLRTDGLKFTPATDVTPDMLNHSKEHSMIFAAKVPADIEGLNTLPAYIIDPSHES